MKTKEKDALTLRPASPDTTARPPHTTSATPEVAPLSFDGRLINFIRSTPLLVHLEHGNADAKDLKALAAHVQKTFPEIQDLRRKLQRTEQRRDELTQTLMGFLRGSYPQLAALMGAEANPDSAQRNGVIDHSARLMWDLSQVEERFHELADKLNKLEATLEEAVEAPYQRLVRWAVRESR